MKNILFDCVPFEDKIINGGAIYTEIVLRELIKQDVKIYGIAFNIDNVSTTIKNFFSENNIELFSIKSGINNIVEKYNIDTFFVGISQRYNCVDLTDISCRIVIVCHDLFDFSMSNSNIDSDYLKHLFLIKQQKLKFAKLRCYKILLKKIIKEKSILGKEMNNQQLIQKFGYQNFSKLISKENVNLVTVSEYSKNAILFYFPSVKNEIKVLFPPLIQREHDVCKEMEQFTTKSYFLLLSANRYNKNIYVFLRQFEKFNSMHGNKFNAIIVGLEDVNTNNTICFKSLSDKQLGYLLSNCYALIYPSLVEGFGYPPIEAMEVGKPVIAAYDTSIPEVCGDGALYFNPLYREDLFLQENKLINDYESYVEKSKRQFIIVSKKQKEDLIKLIDYIMEK
ncbi:MAG: glycosyltransferase [Clostridia bacterium]|nr:glycosyltransferase [Clostridia bacterium]